MSVIDACFRQLSNPPDIGLAITPCDRPKYSGEQTGPIIEERKMWRLGVGPFNYGRGLHRIVAVCGQYPVKNCRVGSCISVAFQFLGF